MVRECLIKKTAKPSSQAAAWHHFAFPLAETESSCCPMPSPTLGGVSVPGLGHSDRSVVVSQCHFNLHFSDDAGCGASLII